MLTFSAFSILKESAVRKILKKYEKQLKENKAKSPEKALGLGGRPLILGNLDEDVSHKNTITSLDHLTVHLNRVSISLRENCVKKDLRLV